MKTNLPALAFSLLMCTVSGVTYGAWVSVDNFESASVGALGGQAGWTTTGENATYEVAADPSNPANQALKATGTSSGSDPEGNAYVSLGSNTIADGTTGTLFFRMRNGADGDFVFGSSDVAVPAGWSDYEGYMVLAGENIRLRDGGSFTNVGTYSGDEWYNVWLVLDHAADTADLYASQGTDPAVLLGAAGAFRTSGNTVHDDLISLNVRMGNAQGNGATGYLDDIYVDTSGVNLANPIPEPATMALVAILLAHGAVSRRQRLA